MSENLFNTIYNPDVLSCIANLSNDEVFTPPDVANAMLDMLPQELFTNPNTKFLDPACKSGVFLREIAKRLLIGLEPLYPDLQERINHIFQNQLYGIAITELTSLLSRRSLYCSKYPNSKYSVSKFEDVQGNIRFKNTLHRWSGGKCIFCGASESEYGGKKREGMESHAYEPIHTTKPQEIWNMKFDVVIGNPPYQLSTTDKNKQAKPIYNLFVSQMKKLNPKYLVMIIPSRWYAGGIGLNDFRDEMMNDKHISKMYYYINGKECFPQNSTGSICYFLRDRDSVFIDCEFSNIQNGIVTTMNRPLNEFPVVVGRNSAVSIIRKIEQQKEKHFADIVGSLMPFGLNTNYRGTTERHSPNDLVLYASNGTTYITRKEITKGFDIVDKYKVMMSKTGAEHAVEPGKDGMYRVFTSSMKAIKPGEVCTHSYFTIGAFDNLEEAENVISYLKTKFVRFLVLMTMSSINLSKQVFPFVPMERFDKPWTDEELYKKYGLSQEEIEMIETTIKPMDGDDDA